MAAPTPGPRGPGASGMIPAEWPAQAADTIVETIAKVKDKTTKPIIVAARGLVYGLLAAVVGTVALILLLVILVRMWDNWMPGDVWVLYLILSVLFSVGGAILLRKAGQSNPAEHA